MKNSCTRAHAKGYTILEVMLAIGIIGALSATATLTYTKFIPMVQAAESLSLMNSEKAKIIKNMSNGNCSNMLSGATGKYGVLSVSGTYNGPQQSNCPTGCILTYTFGSDVSKQLQNKVIQVNLLTSGAFSKIANRTTVEDKYIPKSLKSLISSSAEQCAVVNEAAGMDFGDITDSGGLSGTATGNPAQGGSGNSGATPPDTGGGTTNPPDNGSGGTTPPGDNTNPPGAGDSSGNGGDQPVEVDVDDIARRLSTGLGNVVIEPQAKDYTVVAKPSLPSGKVCSDTLNVKAGEWLVRLGGSSFYDQNKDYSVRGQYALFDEIGSLVDVNKVNGVYQLDKKVIAYNPCTIGIVNRSQRRPSFITNNYTVSSGGELTLINYGAILGKAGSGSIFDIEPSTFVDYVTREFNNTPSSSPGEWYSVTGWYRQVSSTSSKHYFKNYSSIYMPWKNDWADNEPASMQSYLNLYGSMDKIIMEADARGGIPFVNLNPKYRIKIYNYGLLKAGEDGGRRFNSMDYHHFYMSGPTNFPASPTLTSKRLEGLWEGYEDTAELSIGGIPVRASVPYGEPGYFAYNGKTEFNGEQLQFAGRTITVSDYFKSYPYTGLWGPNVEGTPSFCLNSLVFKSTRDLSTETSDQLTGAVTSNWCNRWQAHPDDAKNTYISSSVQSYPRFAGSFELLHDAECVNIPRSATLECSELRGAMPLSVGAWLTSIYTKFDKKDIEHCLIGNNESKFITKNGVRENCFWRGFTQSNPQTLSKDYYLLNGKPLSTGYRADIRGNTIFLHNRELIGVTYPGMGNFRD